MITHVVVDGESVDIDFLTFLLGAEGYAVHAASNGNRALKAIDRVRPALVIIHLKMPVMPGLELAVALGASDEFRDLPIILCSVVLAIWDRVSGLFVAVPRKPYLFPQLIDLMAQRQCGSRLDKKHLASGTAGGLRSNRRRDLFKAASFVDQRIGLNGS
jgi:CheY-like chemotaxis protein